MTWDSACHTQLDGGKLDGFVKSGSGPVAMGYWEQADLPFYYSLASTFPIADRYFCSVLGQTFPNRRYLMAATSLGMINDGVPDPLEYPANGTIFDRLHDAGVTWKDYFSVAVPQPPGAVPRAAGQVPEPPRPGGRVLRRRAGRHAAWVLPGRAELRRCTSEEEPQNIALGELFARQGHQRGHARGQAGRTRC